jgi:hypothetical protein
VAYGILPKKLRNHYVMASAVLLPGMGWIPGEGDRQDPAKGVGGISVK